MISYTNLIFIILLSIFLWKLLSDNRVLIKTLRFELATYLFKALYSWSIIGVIACLMIFLNHELIATAEKHTYDWTFISDECHDPITYKLCDQKRFRQNVIIAVENNINDKNQSVQQELTQTKAEVDKSTKTAAKQTEQLFLRSTPEQLPIKKPKCNKWYDLSCHIVKKCTELIQDYYQSKRDETAESIKQKSQELTDNAKGEIDNIYSQRDELEKYVNEFKYAVVKKINSYFYWFDIWSFWSSLILLLITIKSYLIVLGRTIYRESKYPISFSDELFQNGNGQISYIQDKELFLDLPECKKIYTRHNINISNTEPKIRFTQLLSLTFARIKHHLFFTKQVDIDNSKKNTIPKLNRLTEQEYVVWHLTVHNDVIFQMKPLVAFSDGIKFKWHFSLRLSTIMLGSYFFYNASGKGYLIFKKAKQELSSELGDDNYVDFYRHLAFDKKTKFSLKVSLNPWDTLTSGFNVHNIDNTPSIIDADILDRKKKSTSGVLRYVKYYLIPF